jgi:hypothetical protein
MLPYQPCLPAPVLLPYLTAPAVPGRTSRAAVPYQSFLTVPAVLPYLAAPAEPCAAIPAASGVAETWWDAGGIFACPDTDSFSARCQNREGHSPLAINTAACVHALVLLAAGETLCFGESINLTWT